MRSPSDALVAVTHRCNAHCVMCNVWKSRVADRLQPQHMRRLPPELKTVNLTGGEPFLRDDLPDFVREIRRRCPHVRITISTNAYLVDRICRMMEPIRRIDPAVRLAVSLDGLRESHDAMRGDAGAFDSVLRLLDELPRGGFRGLRLSMTLTSRNVDQLLGVAELAAGRGLELGVVAAHAAATHLGVERSPLGAMPGWIARPFAEAISAWLRSWRPRRWLRAHFACRTYGHIAQRPWKVPCGAGRDFFFVQADATVYSCSVRGRPMGNLAEQTWSQIWQDAAAQQARGEAAACPQRCWMICTARPFYRRRWPSVLLWILTRKPLAHLRLLRLRGPAAPPAEATGAGP